MPPPPNPLEAPRAPYGRAILAAGLALWLAGALTSPSGANAQSDDEPAVVPVSEPTDSESASPRRPGRDRLETRVRVERTVYDNYYRQPDGEDHEELAVDRVELRLLWRLSDELPYKLLLEAQQDNYEGAPSSRTFGSGFRFEGRRLFAESRLEVAANRESPDLEDDPEPADVEHLYNEVSFQPSSDWQITGAGDIEHRTPDSPGKDSQIVELGAALRWRGLGSIFSPEIGFGEGRKNADQGSEEYRQREAYIRLRSRPNDRLYLSLRYRDRWRLYDEERPNASNFDREDRRDEWTVRADVTAIRFLIVNLEFLHIDSGSTREDKAFDSSELSVGISLRR